MPYIEQGIRASLEDGRLPMVAGELNYIVSKIMDEYVTRKGLCYNSINDVMGVFASAQSEFYRRVAAPYEQKKAMDNGEVYINGK